MNHAMTTGISTVILLAVAGCSADVTSPGVGTDPGAPAPRKTTTETATAAAPVTVSGLVHGDGGVLAGVEVCIDSEPTEAAFVATCTASDDAGAWSISDVPANTKLRVTFEKTGYESALRLLETATANVTFPGSENTLAPSAAMASFMGVAADVQKGHIEFFAKNLAGDAVAATVTLRGIAGTNAEPVYLGADGKVLSGATAGGRGGFANLASGYYVLTFQSPGAVCTTNSAIYGYPVDAYQDQKSGEASIVVTVLDGYVTSPVGVTCLAGATAS